MAKLKHYVNLWQKDLFVERGIDSLDRIGPAVFLRAKFKNPDALPVSFRAVLVSEVSPYTDAEKKRNIWYKLQEPIGLEVNEGEEMNATCAALLPPSGGAVYKIEARAGDKTVQSTDEIETWRRLFFQIFYMKDAKEEVKVPNLKETYDYYKSLFVELLDIPENKTAPIPYLENATATDLLRLVRPKYTSFLREPWVLALVFSNALPGFAELEIGAEPYPGNVDLPSRLSGNDELSYKLPEGIYAWWRMNPAHDAQNGGKGVWLRGDGIITVDGKDIVIPKDSITLDASHSNPPGKGFNWLKVKLPEAARSHNLIFSKSAKLTLTLWVADGFSGGFAVGDQNLLAVSRTSWWHDKKKEDTDIEKLTVLNHEFGHKLGMVPKGGRRFGGLYELDAPDKLYGDLDLMYAGRNPSKALKDELKRTNNSKGHKGAHCERGATGKKDGDVWKWTGTPECAMFGATSTADKASPMVFCGPCAARMIRQNLDPADPLGVLSFKSLLDS